MLHWPLVFLFISLITGVYALADGTGAASDIAAVLFVVSLGFALLSAISGRQPRV